MAITKALAIIAGVGAGTGAAVAKRFAQEYNVVLLARSTSSLDPVVQEIQSLGGNAFGIPTDISDAKSVDEAFKQIAAKYPGTAVSAAVFNASAGLIRKPFLELSAEEWDSAWTVNGYVWLCVFFFFLSGVDADALVAMGLSYSRRRCCRFWWRVSTLPTRPL